MIFLQKIMMMSSFGCLDAVGPLAGNIARTAWLTAGLPEAIPGVTVDRQCGSSQQAVHFAAQGIMAGRSRPCYCWRCADNDKNSN